MITLLDKSKVPFFDYFYLLAIIIYAGLASAFAREFGDIRTLGNAVALVLTFAFAIHKRIGIQKELLIILGIFSIYSVFSTVYSGYSSSRFLWLFSQWIIYFYVAYVICKGYGYRFFVLAETILFHLAIISLACWVILLIIPGPFASFLKTFALPAFNEDDRYVSANVLFYTVILSNVTEGFDSTFYFLIRNSGFAWEPGAFACFMCLAISFNMLRTEFKLKNNLPLVIFLIALASTQSTTGYCTFGITLGVWLFLNRKFGWLILLIPAFLAVFNLPFIGDKLDMKMEGFNEATLATAGGGEYYDRILSFGIMWDEFLRHPLFGYGFTIPEFERLELHTWSGMGRLIAQFGVFMTILFFVSLLKSTKRIGIYFSSQYGVIVTITILGSMLSYMIWTQPFFIAIWLSCLFVRDPKKSCFKDKSESIVSL